MAIDSKIPIKNIYYMLCYSWDTLTMDAERMCGSEKFDNIYNLLARILIASTKKIIRRGFHREYIAISEPLLVLRGQMNIQQSISQATMMKNKLICNYDELSTDVPFNQIIKATINVLIRYKDLDKTLCKKLNQLSLGFAEISDIIPSKITFATLKFNRNNQNYKLAMNVCKMVFDGLMSNEGEREVKFSDFIRDRQMATLYEKFVLNYYRHHLSRKDFRVHAPKIPWDIDDLCNQEYLPEMKTDIVLECKPSNTQLIIDTKFYPEIFSQSNYGVKKTFNSLNLYQILAYTNNSKFDGRIMGMLLYPTTHTEVDKPYKIGGKIIAVKTLNLNSEWEDIEKKLYEIAEMASA